MIEIGRLAEERDIPMKKGDTYTKLGDMTVLKSVGVRVRDAVIARYVVFRRMIWDLGRL